MVNEYTIRCHEKGESDSTTNLAFFDNHEFSNLGRATEWAEVAIEAIKRSRSDYQVRHPVIEVIWKRTGRAKYRVELTPAAGQIIRSPIV
jgi:hypothetical protein